MDLAVNAQSLWPDLTLEQLSDAAYFESRLHALHAWLVGELLVASIICQLVVIGLAYVAARFVAPRLRTWVERQTRRRGLEDRLRRGATALAPLTLPVCWLIIQWLSVLIAGNAGWPHHLIKTVVSLLTAWVIIRLTSSVVRDPVWSQAVAVTAWTIAALNILDLLDPTIALLDQLAVSLGGLRISALLVIKGMLAMAVLLGLATFASRLFERRIKGAPSLTPSVQVLFSKLLKIVLVTIAVVVALSSVGIDLTAFALFSGAVGVGIGFGLQKVVANLISGVILLLDRSVKPGDVIGVGNSYGWIDSLGARYVSVVTDDGIEHLIPNEDLITNRVENWSYSNDLVCMKIAVGIAYDSDLRQAMRVCLDAARATPRVLDQPPPECLVTGFGDSSVDLELDVWIRDPINGTTNVKSEVLLNVWDRFHEHGIEIPFPQRDLHIKTPGEFRMLAETATREAARKRDLGIVGGELARVEP
jgi:small-conductance mechanosensitive channel